MGFDEIEIGNASDGFKIAPARGGLVTELTLGGQSLLYLDRDTFDDPAKSVRGGIPVLFPICGPLRDDRYTLDGGTFSMKQHGFARNMPWTEVERGDDFITLALAADASTQAVYPFDFHLRYTYRVRPGHLRIEQRVENRSDRAMPFSAGFHPYFQAADKKALHFDIPAHHAAQNPFGEPQPFKAFDFGADAIDLTFTDVREPQADFDDYRREQEIAVAASVEYRYIVFWTLKDRPFCCLEPWTARGDALNTGLDLIEVAPGENRKLWMEISRKAIDVV